MNQAHLANRMKNDTMQQKDAEQLQIEKRNLEAQVMDLKRTVAVTNIQKQSALNLFGNLVSISSPPVSPRPTGSNPEMMNTVSEGSSIASPRNVQQFPRI